MITFRRITQTDFIPAAPVSDSGQLFPLTKTRWVSAVDAVDGERLNAELIAELLGAPSA